MEFMVRVQDYQVQFVLLQICHFMFHQVGEKKTCKRQNAILPMLHVNLTLFLKASAKIITQGGECLYRLCALQGSMNFITRCPAGALR